MTVDEACDEVLKYRRLAKASEQMLQAVLPDHVASEIHYNGQNAQVDGKYKRAKEILTARNY
jgi:hypothetical protein